MQALADIPTPALLLDEERCRRNIARLNEHFHALGAVMRPHLKTCKNLEVARWCMEHPQGPATVSTLAEAEYFAAGGVRDICYAVGIAPDKLPRAAAIRADGTDLILTLDSMEAARALLAFARSHSLTFAVMLETDCDGHRAGVAPDDPLLVILARMLRDGGQDVRGVLTHAVSAYDGGSPGDLANLAEKERSAAVAAAAMLRDAGIPCPVVSVGSTPTARFCRSLKGVTEVRAGTHVFHDLVMRRLGVCEPDDIALSVLATVIGRRADGGLLLDAGWTALSRDQGGPGGFAEHGYGLVCNLDGHPYPGLYVRDLNQEHGLACGPYPPPLPVGSRVRILPVHACATAACFDDYQLLRGGRPVGTLSRCRGW